MQRQRIAALTLLCVFSGFINAGSARGALVTVNFDSIDALGQVNGVGGATLANYLSTFGITIANATPGTQAVVIDSRNIYTGLEPVVPSSPHNVLGQVGSISFMSYDLVFSEAIDEFTFTRTAIRAGNGIALPEWNVRALDINGNELAAIGEPLTSIFQDIPALTHTFNNPGIASVRFESDAFSFAALGAMTFDDLQFQQVPEPSSLVLALTGLVAVVARKCARQRFSYAC